MTTAGVSCDPIYRAGQTGQFSEETAHAKLQTYMQLWGPPPNVASSPQTPGIFLCGKLGRSQRSGLNSRASAPQTSVRRFAAWYAACQFDYRTMQLTSHDRVTGLELDVVHHLAVAALDRLGQGDHDVLGRDATHCRHGALEAQALADDVVQIRQGHERVAAVSYDVSIPAYKSGSSEPADRTSSRSFSCTSGWSESWRRQKPVAVLVVSCPVNIIVVICAMTSVSFRRWSSRRSAAAFALISSESTSFPTSVFFSSRPSVISWMRRRFSAMTRCPSVANSTANLRVRNARRFDGCA